MEIMISLALVLFISMQHYADSTLPISTQIFSVGKVKINNSCNTVLDEHVDDGGKWHLSQQRIYWIFMASRVMLH